MKEVDRIADQLRRAMEGEAWHGPALLELLSRVDSRRASQRPPGGGHTIWEIVHHIIAWEKEVTRRVNGQAKKLSPGEDWPPVPEATEARWKTTLAELTAGNRLLRNAVSALEDDALDEPVAGQIDSADSVYGMLHGLVQHHLYHAGQIALLKNA